MNAPDLWDDQDTAQKLTTEHSRVAKRVGMYDRLREEYEE